MNLTHTTREYQPRLSQYCYESEVMQIGRCVVYSLTENTHSRSQILRSFGHMVITWSFKKPA